MRALFKLHFFQPLLMVLQARPMLGAGDTQEMEPIQASMAPGGIARRSHEGQWRGGA